LGIINWSIIDFPRQYFVRDPKSLQMELSDGAGSQSVQSLLEGVAVKSSDYERWIRERVGAPNLFHATAVVA
jgi:hypothetical protein